MIMKLWRTRDEWKSYASCGGVEDHTLPPERHASEDPLDDTTHLPVANIELVQRICGACRVRPECIQEAVQSGARGVWVAGRWIPSGTRKAKRVRNELALSLTDEFDARGEDV